MATFGILRAFIRVEDEKEEVEGRSSFHSTELALQLAMIQHPYSVTDSDNKI